MVADKQTIIEKEVEESQIAAENRYLNQLKTQYESEITKLTQKRKFLEEQGVKNREKLRQFNKLVSDLKKVSDGDLYSITFTDLTVIRSDNYNKELDQLEKAEKKVINYQALTKTEETAEEILQELV